MSRRSRNATIISTGLVAIALIAGCSGGTAAPSPGAPAASAPAASGEQEAVALLERVPEATFAAGSARYEMQINVSVQGRNATSSGSGSYDFARNVGDLTMDGEAIGLPGRVETITDGGNVYVRIAGEPNWFRTPGGTGTPGQYDPAKQLELLRNAASDLRIVGTEQVRDAETRHIAFVLDAQQLAQSMGQAGSAGAGAVTGPAPADIWVDSEGRARRYQVRVPLQQQGTPIESNVTIEYFDFGVPVNIQIPDPATVQELPTR